MWLPFFAAIMIQGGNVSGRVEGPELSAAARWSQCVGQSVGRFLGSTETADIIVEAAFGACAPIEREFRRGWIAEFGYNQLDLAVADTRQTIRQLALASILAYRSRSRAGR